MKFYNNADLQQLEVRNAAIQVLASNPATPVTGQLYFSSSLGQLQIWNGTAWSHLASDSQKLNGQAASYYLDRTNHTNTQAPATIATAAASVLIGRYAATAGTGQEITIGTGLSLNTTTGVLSNTVTGTVTSVSVTTLNGVSGSVATATTTPAITLTLGAITPTSVAATGTVTGSNLSGTNTGDQTLTGDVTTTGTGASTAATIAANAVTLSKMAQVATGTVFYRKTAATGNPEVQTLATLKTDLGLTGSNTGDQTITLTGVVTGTGTSSFTTSFATSPTFTGTVTIPTPAANISDTTATSAAFVQNAFSIAAVATTGGASTVTNVQAGSQLLVLTGTLASNAIISLGSGTAAFFNRKYTIINNTTGAFTVTIQACATTPGSTLISSQGSSLDLYTNGASVFASGNDPLALTLFTNTIRGAVPGSGGGTTNFLRADGTWTTPVGATTNTLTINNSGTGSASGTTFNGGTAVTISYNSIGAAPTASPTLTGTVTIPTPTADTNSTAAASTAYVQTSLSTVSIATTGGASTVTTAQAGSGVIIITGVLASNATISLGSGAAAFFNRTYSIINNTTGAFTVTVQACVTAPSGNVVVTQGYTALVYTSGAIIARSDNDANTLPSFSSILKGVVPASGGGTTNFLRADGTWIAPPASTGTVSNVSVVTVNGVSGTVTNPTTTPAISLTLGAITPTSVAASGTIGGSNFSGTHAGTSSGTNTGDQTITLTNDVTGTGTGSFATTIAAGVVTLAKQAVFAANSIQGNNTGIAATPLALSGTQVTAMLDLATGSLKGLMSSSDFTKLAGVAPGATANSSDTFLLSRTNHTGSQLASTISNFQTTVNATTLNSFAAPTANVAMGGFTLSGLSTTPNATGQAAEYSWVLGQISAATSGIKSIKDPVRALILTNVALTGIPVAGNADGVTLVAGDRVLLNGQTTQSQNQIWNVQAGAWTQTVDLTSYEPGTEVLVQEGTFYNGSIFRVATNGTITVGTTSLTWQQINSKNIYTGGNGILLTGSSFAVQPLASGGITVTASGVAVDTTIVARKFSATIGGSTSMTVNHNLGTQDVVVSVRDASTNTVVFIDWVATDTNNVTVVATVAPAASSLRCTVIG